MACHLVLDHRRLNGDVAETVALCETLASSEPPAKMTAPRPSAISDSPDLAGWAAAVSKALAEIDAGRLHKVVLARRRRVSFVGVTEPLQMFIALSLQQPTTFRFFLQPSPDSAFFGASPERLFGLRGEQIWTEALAGTRPRGADEAADVALTRELLGSAKDGREHDAVVQMITAALAPLKMYLLI